MKRNLYLLTAMGSLAVFVFMKKGLSLALPHPLEVAVIWGIVALYCIGLYQEGRRPSPLREAKLSWLRRLSRS